MYTEIVLDVRLCPDPVAHEALRFMSYQCDLPKRLPDHPFFFEPNWQYLFRTCGGPFPEPTWFYTEERLTFRSSIHNYGKQIELFLSWIRLFVRGPYKFRGYHRHEEQIDPILIYL